MDGTLYGTQEPPARARHQHVHQHGHRHKHRHDHDHDLHHKLIITIAEPTSHFALYALPETSAKTALKRSKPSEIRRGRVYLSQSQTASAYPQNTFSYLARYQLILDLDIDLSRAFILEVIVSGPSPRTGSHLRHGTACPVLDFRLTKREL